MNITKIEAEKLITNLTGVNTTIIPETVKPRRRGIHQFQINVGSKRQSGRTTMLRSMANQLATNPDLTVIFSVKTLSRLPERKSWCGRKLSFIENSVQYMAGHSSIFDWVRGQSIKKLVVFFDDITVTEAQEILGKLSREPHLHWSDIDVYMSQDSM